MEIRNKDDQETVIKIVELSFPKNRVYFHELLSWTADPNWPVAMSICSYFVSLGEKAVERILETARKVDSNWRYTLIVCVIAQYDDKTLNKCIPDLKQWACEVGNNECEIESLRILSERNLIPHSEVTKIAGRNVLVYKEWFKETVLATKKPINPDSENINLAE